MSQWFRVTVVALLLGVGAIQHVIASARPHRATLIVQQPPLQPTGQTLPADSATGAVLAHPGGAQVLSHLTQDDVARGVWALSQLPDDHTLSLSTTQRTELLSTLTSGAALRASLDTQRDSARRTRWQLVGLHHRLIFAVGSNALTQARHGETQ